MRRHWLLLLAPLTFLLTLAGSTARPAGSPAELPARLTDQEFWRLTEDLSEPNGAFQSDNLLSNEIVFARLLPNLVAQTKPGGVYLGVGPEQNFTYIAAMQPRIAFITDVRRGNLHLQLMYKALFELSADRADFVSRLFTKKRPDGLTASSTVTDLMNAYWDAWPSDEATYAANLRTIQDHLTKTHAFPLSPEDLDGVARVYRAFYWYGPLMNYSANTSLSTANIGRGLSYWDLMTQTDAGGQGFSYLGSEDKYKVLKTLESKNLVVPVVGNFSGPKALRAVGAYLRDHDATVTAFYLSNVESYLRRDGSWPAFCANVATMPLDDGSVFIRPSGSAMILNAPPVAGGVNGSYTFVGGAGAGAGAGTNRVIGTYVAGRPGTSGLVPMAEEVRNCGR